MSVSRHIAAIQERPMREWRAAIGEITDGRDRQTVEDYLRCIAQRMRAHYRALGVMPEWWMTADEFRNKT